MSPVPRLLFLTLALVACGGARSRANTAVRPASEAVLTHEDIERSNARNAYDAVQFLCPPRVRSTVDRRSIFIDGIRVANASALQGVPTEAILEIRWMEARDAVIRYGSGNADGVILVETRPRD